MYLRALDEIHLKHVKSDNWIRWGGCNGLWFSRYATRKRRSATGLPRDSLYFPGLPAVARDFQRTELLAPSQTCLKYHRPIEL